MPDTEAPFTRMSRVTTRRGTLRQLNCPLEPELLVAEFSGELPPDVAVAVREHMAVCEICGKRAQELHTPYALLSSLGSAPAPYVPDLRENVRVKAARAERYLRPLRSLGSLGRFGLVSAALALVTLIVLIFGVGGLARSLGIFIVQRTTNQLQHVPPAASGGTLLAETDKLVTLSWQGANWQVSEVIVVDQRTGQVTRSLPSSDATLHAASAATLPVGVVTDGQMIYELTARQNGGVQALVGFDVASGATRFVTPLTLPNELALPKDASAVSLTLSPDGRVAYIGLSGPNGALSEPRALIFSTSAGKVTGVVNATTPNVIPLPTPPGSLPPSAFPSVVPVASISGLRQTEAAGGAIVVSPDGQALFDVVLASDAHGVRYAIIRRIALPSGQVSVLGLQGGNFPATQLAASASASSLQVYFVTGSPQATVYVVDASAQGPALLGQIALGGPAAPTSMRLNDTLAVSSAANGARLYITQDTVSSDGVIDAHSRWLVDTQGMGVLASTTDPTTAGSLLGNTVPQGKTFALINGQITIGAPDLSSGWTPWLETNDNLPIIRLIATTR
jgi:anti-sigma factor RsiW